MRKSCFSGSIGPADLLSYDMYRDVEEKLAAEQGRTYTGKFVCGLPVGLKLPNGVTIGE